MITANIFRNGNGCIYGFQVDNHGESIVCAATSAIVLNTVNSMEALTDAVGTCEYDDDGGFIRFEIPNIKQGGTHHDAGLLLNAMLLGLQGIWQENKKQIKIIDKEAK